MRVHIAAGHGHQRGLERGHGDAFSLRHKGGFGRIEHAAVGEGAGRWLACDLAAHRGVFAGADLREGGAAGEQAHEGEQAGTDGFVEMAIFHEIFKGCHHALRSTGAVCRAVQFTKSGVTNLSISWAGVCLRMIFPRFFVRA